MNNLWNLTMYRLIVVTIMKTKIRIHGSSFGVLFTFTDESEKDFLTEICTKYTRNGVASEVCFKEFSDLCVNLIGDVMNERHIDFIEYLIQCFDLRQQYIERLQKLTEKYKG